MASFTGLNTTSTYFKDFNLEGEGSLSRDEVESYMKQLVNVPDDETQEILDSGDAEETGEYGMEMYMLCLDEYLSVADPDTFENIHFNFSEVGKLLSDTLSLVDLSLASPALQAHQISMFGLLITLLNKLQRISHSININYDRIMQLTLRVLASKDSPSREDAYILAGSIACGLGQAISPYVPMLAPFMLADFKIDDDSKLPITCLGMYGDVCRALANNFIPFLDTFLIPLMQHYVSVLGFTENHFQIKTHIHFALSDIALAAEAAIGPYANGLFEILDKATTVDLSPFLEDPEDELARDDVENYYESVLVAYIALVQSLKKGDRSLITTKQIDSIFEFMKTIMKSDCSSTHVIKSAVGLIGDLSDVVKTKYLQTIFLNDPIIEIILEQANNYPEVENDAQWARSVSLFTSHSLFFE
jgi:importin subunit beta-1